MRTLKNVYDRIAESDKKTKLKSEKVELTVVGDIAKAVKTMTSAEKSLETISAQAKKAEDKHEKGLLKAYENSLDDQSKLNDKLKNLRAIQADSKKALDAADKAAKGLGLNAKEIPEYSKLQSLISEYPSKYNAATDDVSRISEVTI